MSGRILILLALSSLLAGDSLAPDVLLLARIKLKAKTALADVPAYACSETVLRSIRPVRRLSFQKLDELKLEVAEIGGRELFAKEGAKTFDERGLPEMIGRGLIATGMFYHLAGKIFTGHEARFQFAGKSKVKGHKAVRYDFAVSPLFAGYRLQFNGHTADCGFKGSFWADESTFDLIRVHIEATDVPADLRLVNATTEIDYNRASFSGKNYLIPASSQVDITFQSGEEHRDEIRFAKCHKYGAESTISFQ
jgi:hypothetical protein